MFPICNNRHLDKIMHKKPTELKVHAKRFLLNVENLGKYFTKSKLHKFTNCLHLRMCRSHPKSSITPQLCQKLKANGISAVGFATQILS